MIIGFNGKMGVGKSTAINAIRSLKSVPFIPVFNVKFAGPLYQMQELIYDIVKPVHKRPADFVKDRKLLQWLGTEWGRGTISESIWVDLWAAAAKQHSVESPRSIIVSDDVRFDNEAETIRKLGGFVVEIISDKNKERIDTEAGIKQHSSEAGINPKLVDYTVSNNGTMAEFDLAIRNLVGLLEYKERNR